MALVMSDELAALGFAVLDEKSVGAADGWRIEATRDAAQGGLRRWYRVWRPDGKPRGLFLNAQAAARWIVDHGRRGV